ncbi:MAG TPA: tetratricopeptide repeat protein [Nitrospira sp.]|nr:tetratricopeptide repeat protein [Nitrospira sp.]
MKRCLALFVCLFTASIGSVSWADMGKAPMPLKAPTGSKAETHINEGVVHYEKGHFDVAKKHFSEAAKADPQSAEAHYDLALALDRMGDHGGATEQFKEARELGKNNPEIQNSDILKKHLKM